MKSPTDADSFLVSRSSAALIVPNAMITRFDQLSLTVQDGSKDHNHLKTCTEKRLVKNG
jgi:hypothetical protein